MLVEVVRAALRSIVFTDWAGVSLRRTPSQYLAFTLRIVDLVAVKTQASCALIVTLWLICSYLLTYAPIKMVNYNNRGHGSRQRSQ